MKYLKTTCSSKSVFISFRFRKCILRFNSCKFHIKFFQENYLCYSISFLCKKSIFRMIKQKNLNNPKKSRVNHTNFCCDLMIQKQSRSGKSFTKKILLVLRFLDLAKQLHLFLVKFIYLQLHINHILHLHWYLYKGLYVRQILGKTALQNHGHRHHTEYV